MDHSERRQVAIYDVATERYVLVSVMVKVNITELARQYASRARRNKTGKAKQCHGAVEVEFIE
jgi:hypothetical protein